MSTRSIYIAASSGEIERAEHWIAACRAQGVVVTSTWPETIRRVQAELKLATSAEAGNPRELSLEEQRKAALSNAKAVRDAQVFWLLAPIPPNYTQGGYWEFGVAWDASKLTVVSGGDQRYVFTSVADYRYKTDEEAFEQLMAHRSLWRAHQGRSTGAASS